jgi:hypothetical protein
LAALTHLGWIVLRGLEMPIMVFEIGQEMTYLDFKKGNKEKALN